MGVEVTVVGCSPASCCEGEESMMPVGLRGAEVVSMAMGFHIVGLVPAVSECVCVCVHVCVCVCVCTCMHIQDTRL